MFSFYIERCWRDDAQYMYVRNIPEVSFYCDQQLCGVLDWITVPLPALPWAGQQCILSVCLVSYSLGLPTNVEEIPEIEIDTWVDTQPLIATRE